MIEAFGDTRLHEQANKYIIQLEVLLIKACNRTVLYGNACLSHPPLTSATLLRYINLGRGDIPGCRQARLRLTRIDSTSYCYQHNSRPCLATAKPTRPRGNHFIGHPSPVDKCCNLQQVGVAACLEVPRGASTSARARIHNATPHTRYTMVYVCVVPCLGV